ncbi:phosphoribosylamine--glycine ligase [Rhizobiales bacterium GAS191]|nr:phosphoribosylamine--glycine ligase [Rhizobiales bacterium GAS191]SED19416.1 phosphoribosylamine--glycine ligase [Rhizobiales bacterium GAS188]
MNILLIGSGAREHALAARIAASPLCDLLLVAPGNPGTAQCGRNIAVDPADHGAVIAACKEHAIDLVVIGPEAPLVAGIVDDLEAAGIAAFGPSKAAAQLEGSKAFTKELCLEAGLPTAAFARFTDAAAAKAYLGSHKLPVVIKADGLAAGKGVVVATSLAEAEAAVDDMLGGRFGEASAEIVIEEFLSGEEASLFALCDGVTALPFGTAQDHKRAFDGDTGPNTGGMGAFSPAVALDDAMVEEVMAEIIRPTLAAMQKRGTPFRGFLYAGLMVTAEGPKLIEYNCRFGDPECQVVMPRLMSDLVTAMLAARDGMLANFTARFSPKCAVGVVIAATGYPGEFRRGEPILGLDVASALAGVTVFQAGTKSDGTRLLSNGGRVLTVVGEGQDFAQAHRHAYAGVAAIDWPGGFHRSDIGARAL